VSESSAIVVDDRSSNVVNQADGKHTQTDTMGSNDASVNTGQFLVDLVYSISIVFELNNR
jgi:hypothetical protein